MAPKAALAITVALLTAGGVATLKGLLPRLNPVTSLPGIVALGYLTGTAIFAVISQTLVVAGLPYLGAVLATPLAGAAIMVGGKRRRRRPSMQLGMSWTDLCGAGILATVLLMLLVLGVYASSRNPIHAADAWANWTIKALMLHYTGDFDTEFFTRTGGNFSHPDYPIGMPALEAAYFWIRGAVDTRTMPVLLWLTLPAGIGGTALLASMKSRARYWGPTLAALALLPEMIRLSGSGYMDTPMTMMLFAAIAAGSLWLSDRDPGMLALTAILIAGASCTKAEGAIIGAILMLLLTLLGRDRPRQCAAAWALFIASILPWRIFTAVNGLKSNDFSAKRIMEMNYISGTLWKPLKALEATGYSMMQSDHFTPRGTTAYWGSLGNARLVWMPVAIAAGAILFGTVKSKVSRFAIFAIVGAALAIAVSFWFEILDLDYMIVVTLPRSAVIPISFLIGGAVMLCDSTATRKEPSGRGKPSLAAGPSGSAVSRDGDASSGREPDRS